MYFKLEDTFLLLFFAHNGKLDFRSSWKKNPMHMKDYDVILYVCIRAQVNICVWLSKTEQMLYSGGEVSSGADEDLQVCFSVSEAH